jgi:hypothetical protein
MPLLIRAVAVASARFVATRIGRAERAVNTWRLSIIRSSMAARMGEG